MLVRARSCLYACTIPVGSYHTPGTKLDFMVLGSYKPKVRQPKKGMV